MRALCLTFWVYSFNAKAQDDPNLSFAEVDFSQPTAETRNPSGASAIRAIRSDHSTFSYNSDQKAHWVPAWQPARFTLDMHRPSMVQIAFEATSDTPATTLNVTIGDFNTQVFIQEQYQYG